MSDLVGNPEDQFSHYEAHIRLFEAYVSGWGHYENMPMQNVALFKAVKLPILGGFLCFLVKHRLRRSIF